MRKSIISNLLKFLLLVLIPGIFIFGGGMIFLNIGSNFFINQIKEIQINELNKFLQISKQGKDINDDLLIINYMQSAVKVNPEIVYLILKAKNKEG